MDALDQWPLNLIATILPPSLISTIHAHLAPLSKPVADLMAALGALLAPLAARFTDALFASPDLVFLGVVLALLWLALQVLSWVRRVVVFWTRVVFNLALLGCLGVLLALAWHRGPEQTLRDCVVVVTKAVGFAAGVGAHAGDMWRTYEEDERLLRRSGVGGNLAGANGARWK